MLWNGLVWRYNCCVVFFCFPSFKGNCLKYAFGVLLLRVAVCYQGRRNRREETAPTHTHTLTHAHIHSHTHTQSPTKRTKTKKKGKLSTLHIVFQSVTLRFSLSITQPLEILRDWRLPLRGKSAPLSPPFDGGVGGVLVHVTPPKHWRWGCCHILSYLEEPLSISLTQASGR